MRYNEKKGKTDKYAVEKEEIIELFNHHKQRYGYRRITDEMREKGYIINHKTVLKLMKSLNLKGKQRKNEKYHGCLIGLSLYTTISGSNVATFVGMYAMNNDLFAIPFLTLLFYGNRYFYKLTGVFSKVRIKSFCTELSMFILIVKSSNLFKRRFFLITKLYFLLHLIQRIPDMPVSPKTENK